MTCQEFQVRLQQLLDADPFADRLTFDQHRHSCTACAEHYAAALVMERAIRSVAPPAAPASLPGRIVTQLLHEHRLQARSRNRARWNMAAAAAIVLVVLGGMLAWQRNGAPRELRGPVANSARLASSTPDPATSDRLAPHVEPVPSLNDSLAEARSALTSLVSQTADEAFGPGRLLIPERVDPALTVLSAGGWPPTLESAPPALLDAGHGVSASLEPVANSARRAVTVFFQEIPMLGSLGE